MQIFFLLIGLVYLYSRALMDKAVEPEIAYLERCYVNEWCCKCGGSIGPGEPRQVSTDALLDPINPGLHQDIMNRIASHQAAPTGVEIYNFHPACYQEICAQKGEPRYE
jgi:hypothetical protein